VHWPAYSSQLADSMCYSRSPPAWQGRGLPNFTANSFPKWTTNQPESNNLLPSHAGPGYVQLRPHRTLTELTYHNKIALLGPADALDT
jgi:hypothetical protein